MIPYSDLTAGVISPIGMLSVLFPSFEGMGQGEIWTAYIGVLPFFLACIAIGRCWSNLWVRYLAGLSIAAMLYALGGVSALHGLSYALVPWIWMAREGTRFIYLTGFGLAVLAGFGIDAYRFRSSEDPFWNSLRRFMTWVIAGCCLVLLSAPILSKPGMFWIFFSTLMLLASCGLLRFGLARRQTNTSWHLLAIALVFFDLNASSWLVSSKTDADRANRNEFTVLTSMGGVARFLKSRPGIFRVSVFRDPTPNLGDAFAIQSTSGAGVTFDNYFDAMRGNGELLNSRYTVKPAASGDPNPVYQDAFWKIYENPKAFPRSWLVHETQLETDDAKVFHAVTHSDIDFHKVAFVSTPLPGSVASGREPLGEKVSIRSYSANRITTAVRAQTPALLVFSELFYPGWYATVNGKEAPLYRADGGLRSVLVPGGDSTVELSYRPWPVIIGASLSATAFLATLLTFALSRRRPDGPADLAPL